MSCNSYSWVRLCNFIMCPPAFLSCFGRLSSTRFSAKEECLVTLMKWGLQKCSAFAQSTTRFVTILKMSRDLVKWNGLRVGWHPWTKRLIGLWHQGGSFKGALGPFLTEDWRPDYLRLPFIPYPIKPDSVFCHFLMFGCWRTRMSIIQIDGWFGPAASKSN